MRPNPVSSETLENSEPNTCVAFRGNNTHERFHGGLVNALREAAHPWLLATYAPLHLWYRVGRHQY